MPLTGSDSETAEIMRRKRAAAAARPNDGVESSSFTPFSPASTPLEALNNAQHGYTPDGDLLWSPAAPGQAQEMLTRALGGESGVGVRLQPVIASDVVVPIVIGSFEDAYYELFDARCHPDVTLDFDLRPDGIHPVPKGRFASAIDPFAVTLAMLGCGFIKTSAQITAGQPKPDVGLALPAAKLKLALAKAKSAASVLEPFETDRPQGAEQEAINAAARHVASSVSTLDAATRELDLRISQRQKGGSFTVASDKWGPSDVLNGTTTACSMTLDQVYAAWLEQKSKVAGTPGAGASGGEVGTGGFVGGPSGGLKG